MRLAQPYWSVQAACRKKGWWVEDRLIIIDPLHYRQEVETKRSIVTLFLARFTLNDEDIDAITSRDVHVGRRFFEAMDKTEQIRNDCRVLMAGEDGPTKVG